MSQGDTPAKREIKKGRKKVLNNPPMWLPVMAHLTYNELHSALLGLTGLVVGALYAHGLVVESVAVSFILVGMAFGLRRMPADKPVAARVIRREPWYFTTVYLVMTVASAGVIEVVL